MAEESGVDKIYERIGRVLRKIALAGALAATSLAAWADGPGQISAYAVPPGAGYDARLCVFFQTNNGPWWYAVPKNDPMFDSEQKLLEGAAFTGFAITFSEGPPPSCGIQGQGWPLAYFIYVGTAH